MSALRSLNREDSELRLIEHRHLDRFAEVTAAAVADPGPQTLAAAFLGVLLSLCNRLADEKRASRALNKFLPF